MATQEKGKKRKQETSNAEGDCKPPKMLHEEVSCDRIVNVYKRRDASSSPPQVAGGPEESSSHDHSYPRGQTDRGERKMVKEALHVMKHVSGKNILEAVKHTPFEIKNYQISPSSGQEFIRFHLHDMDHDPLKLKNVSFSYDTQVEVIILKACMCQSVFNLNQSSPVYKKFLLTAPSYHVLVMKSDGYEGGYIEINTKKILFPVNKEEQDSQYIVWVYGVRYAERHYT